MSAQPNGPAFFFYNPDTSSEGRQHGHFVPQQHSALQQMQMLPVVPPLPSTPIYPRPGSSSSQPPLLPKGLASAPTLPSTMTPVASPMPIAPKPTIVLDTELCESEGSGSPSTPPLSTSSSAISSPGSYDVLQTPLNPMLSGLDGKDACGSDGDLESFPSFDWSTCASPPLTPGKLFGILYSPSRLLVLGVGMRNALKEKKHLRCSSRADRKIIIFWVLVCFYFSLAAYRFNA